MFNFGEMLIERERERDKGKVGMINQPKHKTYLHASRYNK
jgi:hypothetical protein